MKGGLSVCLCLSICLGSKSAFLSDVQFFQLKCFRNNAGPKLSHPSSISPQVHVLPYTLQSQNSGPSRFQVHGACGIRGEPFRKPSARLAGQMHPFTACQCCRCEFGSLQVSHEIKMTRKLQHKSLHKSPNLHHPLTSPLKVLMKRADCLIAGATFNTGQKLTDSLSQALGSI